MSASAHGPLQTATMAMAVLATATGAVPAGLARTVPGSVTAPTPRTTPRRATAIRAWLPAPSPRTAGPERAGTSGMTGLARHMVLTPHPRPASRTSLWPGRAPGGLRRSWPMAERCWPAAGARRPPEPLRSVAGAARGYQAPRAAAFAPPPSQRPAPMHPETRHPSESRPSGTGVPLPRRAYDGSGCDGSGCAGSGPRPGRTRGLAAS